MFERMASFGTAPEEGCNIFGVGYEEAFSRIKSKYFNEQFKRGTSSEKFVVGPFGSGKTHFIRQLMEIARDMDCITAEVVLNKDVDFTKSLIVYSELVRELKIPGFAEGGIRALIRASIEKVKSQIDDDNAREAVLNGWISGIDKNSFKLDTFGKVIKKALIAEIEQDETILNIACRWLEGDFNDKSLSRDLGIIKIDQSSNNLYAKRVMLSLFQFIRNAGFRGTVVCFDEAEQGLYVDKKKTERILSMLMSGIEAITNLEGGSTLIVYAVTPDLVDKMKTFAALQQRILSPLGKGFLDGNTLAPIIDLQRRDPEKDLILIGNKLVELFYDSFKDSKLANKEQVLCEVKSLSRTILENNISSSNRRDMVKATCSMLLGVLENGSLEAAASLRNDNTYEAEV